MEDESGLWAAMKKLDVGGLPQVLVKGQPGVQIELVVSYQYGRKHLPVVTLRRAA